MGVDKFVERYNCTGCPCATDQDYYGVFCNLDEHRLLHRYDKAGNPIVTSSECELVCVVTKTKDIRPTKILCRKARVGKHELADVSDKKDDRCPEKQPRASIYAVKTGYTRN